MYSKNIEEKFVYNVYSTISKSFDTTRSYVWKFVKEFQDIIDDDFERNNELVVYDIGCGNGKNMKHYYKGIDYCDEFLSICKKKNLSVSKENILTLTHSIINNSVDYAICIAVLHHLVSPKDHFKALHQIYTILKKNGVLLISNWSIYQPKKSRRYFHYGSNLVPWKDHKDNSKINYRHYYIFKKNEFINLCKLVGFKIITYQNSFGNDVFILKK